MGSLIFIGHFPQSDLYLVVLLWKMILQLRGSYESSPPCSYRAAEYRAADVLQGVVAGCCSVLHSRRIDKFIEQLNTELQAQRLQCVIAVCCSVCCSVL